MITKIANSLKYGKQHGEFGVQILYPGLIKPALPDTGFSTIGRIDHARINPGTLIPMHPHQNDEILTYLRSGSVDHKDSEGNTGKISNNNLMLMNAGANFYHEEQVLEEGGILEALQIFIRPETADLPSGVQFAQLKEPHSVNHWRTIAGKDADVPLQFRSDTWVMDLRLEKGEQIGLPEAPATNCTYLFYLFEGEVNVDGELSLTKGESVLLETGLAEFQATRTSDIVLLITRTTAAHYDRGMYSGNLHL
ncbi:pirin family protein [Mucilaginibacter lutimaris]|uniref:Pirin family protein n=1 Tax=Mucilaginibacter lutimaris TaxID=931629 RepID=A0ABW2ZDZ9_9SPHI